jgi:hypothetical protein
MLDVAMLNVMMLPWPNVKKLFTSALYKCVTGITIKNIILSFSFSLIIEGTTEKVLEFLIPFKSVYHKNNCFNAQKIVF